MSIFGKLTIVNKGLRYKLMLAFSLMTLIPLLTCMYIISTYLFPRLSSLVDVSIPLVISILVAVLGLILAKGIIDQVIDMAVEAKIIAGGDYDHRIDVMGEDEIGTLGESINFMTYKIKTNLDELKNYGQKMKDINIDIHKKVFTLSNLLQVGDAISSGTVAIDSLVEMAVEKAAQLFDGGFGILYMPKAEGMDLVVRTSFNLSKEKLSGLVIKKGGCGVLDRLLDNGAVMVLDRGLKSSKEIEDFKATCNIKNLIAVPIQCGRKMLGLLLIGNRADDYKYKDDDVDLIKTFAKQIAIAVENDILSKRTESLVISDDLTGLYNKNFIMARLEEEIKRAIFYQRPCSLVVLNVDGFKKFRDSRGELASEEALKRLGKVIKDSTMPVAKVARIGGDEFAILLPEKNKKEAAYLAEEIRKKIEATNLLKEGKAALTVSGGVSENPIDGMTNEELLKKASEALSEAKSAGKNTIIA